MSKLVFGGETLITATELDAKGYQDSSAVAGAIATATEGLATDASVASAIETAVNGLATDASVEAAIASATAGFQTAADVSAAINGAGFLTEVSVGSFATPASDPSFGNIMVPFNHNNYQASSWGHSLNGVQLYVTNIAEGNYGEWDGNIQAIKFKAYYEPEEAQAVPFHIGYTSGDMGETFVPLVSFGTHTGGTADITVDMNQYGQGDWTKEFFRQKATVNAAEGVQIVWPELTAADYDNYNSKLDPTKNWAYIYFPYKYYTLYIEGEDDGNGNAPNTPYFLDLDTDADQVEMYMNFTPGQAAGNALDSRIEQVVNGMDLNVDIDTAAIDASISALDSSVSAINGSVSALDASINAINSAMPTDLSDLTNNTGFLKKVACTQAEYDALEVKDPNTIYITEGQNIELVQKSAFDASINAINNAGYQTAADVSNAIGTAMSSALHMVTLTQEQYDALQEKAANTLYIISEE